MRGTVIYRTLLLSPRILKQERLFSNGVQKKIAGVRSFPVTSILFQDQQHLLSWAAGFAADHVRQECEKRAGKPLFDNDWPIERKIASDRFKAYSDERKTVGSKVHEAISKLLDPKRKDKFDIAEYKNNEEVYACVQAIEQWFAISKYTVIDTEFDVRSEKHKFHGKVDCAIKNTELNHVQIVDFKIKPKELDFTIAMQLAAYQVAYNEMKGLKEGMPDYCSSALVVQIKYEKGKGAQVVEKTLRDLKAATTAFHCRNLLYRLEMGNDSKVGFSDSWLFSN